MITSDGTVSTVAGLTDAVGSADGLGDTARFDLPFGVAIEAAGNLYVTSNTTIRKLVLPAAPVITAQPQNAGFIPGGSATFTVAASGSPAPTFQWQFKGSAISGATNSSLTLSNLRDSDIGAYTVVASNALGSVTSSPATMVRVSPQPNPNPGTNNSGGGGGAPSEWFLLALLALAGVRRLTDRNRICVGAK
jgi:hypothetical protein